MEELVVLFIPLMGVIFVILLAYFGTKFIAKKYSGIVAGKYLKIIERVTLGQDKALVLVTLAEKTYLLGVTSKSINEISVLEEGELPLIEQAQVGNSFSEIFSSIKSKQTVLGDLFTKKDPYHKSKNSDNKEDER